MPNTQAQTGKGNLIPGYETTIITRNELTDEALKLIQERMGTVVAQFDGTIVLHEDWGKKKLAYPIKKETRGHYTYLVYNGKPGVVHEVERNLRIHEHVLRFLTVTLGKEFSPDDFKKSRTDAQAAAKRREEEREARREERNHERRYDHSEMDYDMGDMGSDNE